MKLKEDIKENVWSRLFPYKRRETKACFGLIQTLDDHQLSQCWLLYFNSVDISKFGLLVIFRKVLLLNSYLSVVVVLAGKEQMVGRFNL